MFDSEDQLGGISGFECAHLVPSGLQFAGNRFQPHYQSVKYHLKKRDLGSNDMPQHEEGYAGSYPKPYRSSPSTARTHPHIPELMKFKTFTIGVAAFKTISMPYQKGQDNHGYDLS